MKSVVFEYSFMKPYYEQYFKSWPFKYFFKSSEIHVEQVAQDHSENVDSNLVIPCAGYHCFLPCLPP